jgi:hypothetical protein
MITFKLGKRKSIKERKLAFFNQINKINSELNKLGQPYNKDYIYQPNKY